MKHKNYLYILLLITSAAVSFGCNQTDKNNTTEASNETVSTTNQPAAPASQVNAGKNKIAGSWTRTDAPYNLRIADFSDDGTMKAEYFNPNPIHVGKATWAEANGEINIYVELRDENYPGSNYTLFYVADKDMLAGKYFQAVEGVTYDIEFIRAK